MNSITPELKHTKKKLKTLSLWLLHLMYTLCTAPNPGWRSSSEIQPQLPLPSPELWDGAVLARRTGCLLSKRLHEFEGLLTTQANFHQAAE
jgi:hypothetical protein